MMGRSLPSTEERERNEVIRTYNICVEIRQTGQRFKKSLDLSIDDHLNRDKIDRSDFHKILDDLLDYHGFR